MQKVHGLIVLGVVAIAGCDLSTDVQRTDRIGVMNVSQLTSGDTATLTVDATFFQARPNVSYSVPNTAVVGDTCSVEDYDGPVELPPVPYDNLNAGPSIAVSTDKADATLLPAPNSDGNIFYSMEGGPAPFTPGSDVTIEIPGDSGGFPAQSLKVRTLVAPTVAPIERHPEEDMQITWSPAGSPTGAVQLQFLFSSDSNATPDRVMLCGLRDDGSQVIPRFKVGEWAASPDEAQSVSGYRWNTTIQQREDVLMDVITQVKIDTITLATDAADVSEARVNASR
jgi:hypothetical protein